MKSLLVLLLLAPCAFASTTVTTEQLRQGGVTVTGYTLEIAPKECPNPEYAVSDVDHDGYLDDACDIDYDPCDHDSIAEAYDRWQMSGQLCSCDDLVVSPRPKGCEDD